MPAIRRCILLLSYIKKCLKSLLKNLPRNEVFKLAWNEFVDILLVDDQPENLLALESVLDDSGYNLVKAHSGVEALRCLLKRDFAVIVLDVQMPGMDGFETAQWIKSREKTKTIPIIFITASKREEEFAFTAYSVGAIDFMVKPFSPQILRSKIEGFVQMHKAQKKLQLQTELLNEQAKEMQKAKEVAESAAKAKSEFLAMMSHEIRTPMNGVIAMSDLLLETDLSPDQKDYAETIHKSGNALLLIINDILDLSKMESGKMELLEEPFELNISIAETLDLFSLECRKKSILLEQKVDPEIPEQLFGDVTRLRQILINLIGNAVKFTDSGRIDVEARLKTMLEDRLEIEFSVRDTGIGIDEEFIGSLFRPFSQLDSSTTRKYGGTGLGLAICKSLVELMHGTIGVQLNEGPGTTFVFSIFLYKTI
jgi:signal transduction histidine kinase